MKTISALNDFVVRFANVNGTGSASANNLFAKAIFRMGIPVSPKNIFPSNIQGLPTWYEVRISESGYTGRRGGVDMVVCVNPQSLPEDIASVEPGGFFLYDNSKPLHDEHHRDDIHYLGIPLTSICLREYTDPRQRLLFKNVIYVGALAALLDIEFPVLTGLIEDQFKGKEKLQAPNVHALELGYSYAREHFDCPLPIRVERRDSIGERILVDGNTATGLGAIYGGATLAAWYPITPSTSVVEAFEKYCNRLRIDPGTGKKNFAVVQAEDELSAMGMAIGGGWNGARAFTATSGPGISLMSEFLGLAYFAEVPAVLVDVQRAGPSTGMPTRTQQSDILACAYASHGDTRHPLLIPSSPQECFEFMAQAFDLAEQLQTPVILLSDLDLGMNDHLSEPLQWHEGRKFRRGKVLDHDQLEALEEPFGRYLDVDGDGIPQRTLPGTHPTRGAFFTRGTSRDEYARYTEKSDAYVKNMDRLTRKWQTARTMVPASRLQESAVATSLGVLFFGTSRESTLEAVDQLAAENIYLDCLQLMAFPFDDIAERFIESHSIVFVVEQNRDGQMRSLIMNELNAAPEKLVPVLNYDGYPITARFVADAIAVKLSREPQGETVGKKVVGKVVGGAL
ncbi:2-oxoacid:acceptor oxidoreductase subunit alpha [Biformimicrobium ophioploci]|uniref:2-oxoacid:acceptor oxidoreductase subunit alpha n=1 Tax=Biformimicrobium ophioploci TaxID=3036711 RepID=A0ABQ6LY59_9GAMM|nr:2-oxoacid:acceptor oxidoreductase subunit alpha [Microbulbifer sp. NKW57]GMG87028.1 2-oxoacid:acceptor oxidoreductase subunit alpha [Microbulbifer sp. NKW57]